MVEKGEASPPPASAIHQLAALGLFIVVVALCLLDFVVWRQAGFFVFGWLLGESYWLPVAAGVWQILLGLGLFVLVMATEPYLRHGVRQHQIRHRSARILVPLAAAAIAGGIVQEIARLASH